MPDMLARQEKAQKNFGKNFETVVLSSPYLVTKVTFLFRDGCLLMIHGENDAGNKYVAFVGGLTPDLAMEKAASCEILPWRDDKGYNGKGK